MSSQRFGGRLTKQGLHLRVVAGEDGCHGTEAMDNTKDLFGER